MRDQTPVGTDHIRVALLAYFDLRNDVPDQLQIDFGHAHAGVTPRAGHRQRHVRLRLAAEINGSIVDLVSDSPGEFGIFRVVDAAVDYVHRQTGNFESLFAR